MLTVDSNVRVTTPYHRAHNRVMEILRGGTAHGSCGVGIGATMQFSSSPELVLRGHHLAAKASIGARLVEQRQVIQEDLLAAIANAGPLTETVRTELQTEMAAFEPCHIRTVVDNLHEQAALVKFVKTERILEILASRSAVFEAAQGVLLDEVYGFHPHSTWSDTTTKHALELTDQLDVMTSVVGVMRTYMTRHGAGPMPTEATILDDVVQENHNRTERFQGRFRNGWLDLNLIRYALGVSGSADTSPIGSVALTHMDYLKRRKFWNIAVGYQGSVNSDLWKYMGEADGTPRAMTAQLAEAKPYYVEVLSEDVPAFISEQIGLGISIESHGPDRKDKVFSGPDGVLSLTFASPSDTED